MIIIGMKVGTKKMKNNGFTLIELLAVIVILAVIALIATPIILGVIETSREGAAKNSALGYVDAIEKQIAIDMLDPTNAVIDLTDETITVGTDDSELTVKGTKPTSGTLKVNRETGIIEEGILEIKIGGKKYIVNYNGTTGKATIEGKESSEEKEEYKEAILNGADPVLNSNLIPVVIANDGTVTKADTTKEWYKYEDKKWANAVILTDTGKVEEDGIIKEESIESYFVWIPRYKYQIFDLGNYETYAGTTQPNESNAKEIQIVFENKETSVSNGNAVGEYLSHPAFQAFDTNGLWVGKFETTGSIDSLTIKPSVKSIRSQNVSTMFITALAYKQENKSHMMKNTEWGAVAYLSHSKYGINKEININNNSDYLTGYSAVEGTDQSDYPGPTGTAPSVTLSYNTDTGYKASTTGNITGIYDMSGGAYEYMASYMDGQYGSSGFTSDPITTYGKEYFDKYSSTSTITSYGNRILGDATGEMGSFYYYLDGDNNNRYHNGWYADASHFVDSSYPWFGRGGNYKGGVLAGKFYFAGDTGGSAGYSGFRLVLV